MKKLTKMTGILLRMALSWRCFRIEGAAMLPYGERAGLCRVIRMFIEGQFL
jgi:hypothetical protein